MRRATGQPVRRIAAQPTLQPGSRVVGSTQQGRRCWVAGSPGLSRRRQVTVAESLGRRSAGLPDRRVTESPLSRVAAHPGNRVAAQAGRRRRVARTVQARRVAGSLLSGVAGSPLSGVAAEPARSGARDDLITIWDFSGCRPESTDYASFMGFFYGIWDKDCGGRIIICSRIITV